MGLQGIFIFSALIAKSMRHLNDKNSQFTEELDNEFYFLS